MFGGEELPHLWSEDHDSQAAYDASEVALARHIEAEAGSLDVTAYVPSWKEEASLRPLVLHLIHEYARHNGHAALLREAIDGATGSQPL